MTNHPAGRGLLWRPAPVLWSLRQELDVGWPHRSTASDGFIGDQSHKARKSDHNPDQYGYVRAVDVTADVHRGPPMRLLAEFLRDVGRTGSQRLANGGYVIYDSRIASEASEWEWVAYSGENPHVTHLHLSCSRLPEFYKITRPWQVVTALDKRWRKYRSKGPGGF